MGLGLGLRLLVMLRGQCRWGSIVSDCWVCLCRRDGIIAFIGSVLVYFGCFFFIYLWRHGLGLGLRLSMSSTYLHCRNERTSTPVNDAIDFGRSF